MMNAKKKPCRAHLKGLAAGAAPLPRPNRDGAVTGVLAQVAVAGLSEKGEQGKSQITTKKNPPEQQTTLETARTLRTPMEADD
jgi:hypothetical protein